MLLSVIFVWFACPFLHPFVRPTVHSIHVLCRDPFVDMHVVAPFGKDGKAFATPSKIRDEEKRLLAVALVGYLRRIKVSWLHC